MNSFVDEPLIETASRAAAIASQQCTLDPTTGESCAWYHGSWQFLRLFGLGKTSGGHAAFLVEGLRAFARAGGGARVMVAGSADYSMPAHAIAAYRAEGVLLDLHVIDRCETPLVLSRWYAAHVGATITGTRASVLEFQPERPFDLIFTNSFLGYFDHAARRVLFARWAAALRPGGQLLFTNRLRPGGGVEAVGFTAPQAAQLVETVRLAALAHSAELTIDIDTLVERVRRYAERFRSYPLASADEVIALLDASGFAVARLDTATARDRSAATAVSGPTMSDQSDYVRVIAVRR